MLFGKRVRLFRKRAGMTQEELALASGYKDKSAINKIENGVSDLTTSRIIKLAQALSVSPAQLVGWDNSSPAGCLEVAEVGLDYTEEKATQTPLPLPDFDLCLRCQDDSLKALGLSAGDLLLVRKTEELKADDLAVLSSGQQYLVKKYPIDEDLKAKDSSQLLGKLVASIRCYNS